MFVCSLFLTEPQRFEQCFCRCFSVSCKNGKTIDAEELVYGVLYKRNGGATRKDVYFCF